MPSQYDIPQSELAPRHLYGELCVGMGLRPAFSDSPAGPTAVSAAGAGPEAII